MYKKVKLFLKAYLKALKKNKWIYFFTKSKKLKEIKKKIMIIYFYKIQFLFTYKDFKKKLKMTMINKIYKLNFYLMKWNKLK